MERPDTPLPARFQVADPSAWRAGYGHRLLVRDPDDREPWIEFRRTWPGQRTRHAALSRCAATCLEILQDQITEGER